MYNLHFKVGTALSPGNFWEGWGDYIINIQPLTCPNYAVTLSQAETYQFRECWKVSFLSRVKWGVHCELNDANYLWRIFTAAQISSGNLSKYFLSNSFVLWVYLFLSSRPGRYFVFEQVFGSEQRSLNNEVELDERTWFIKANTNIWDIILDWVLLGH